MVRWRAIKLWFISQLAIETRPRLLLKCIGCDECKDSMPQISDTIVQEYHIIEAIKEEGSAVSDLSPDSKRSVRAEVVTIALFCYWVPGHATTPWF
jgi:hypothetical protein